MEGVLLWGLAENFKSNLGNFRISFGGNTGDYGAPWPPAGERVLTILSKLLPFWTCGKFARGVWSTHPHANHRLRTWNFLRRRLRLGCHLPRPSHRIARHHQRRPGNA